MRKPGRRKGGEIKRRSRRTVQRRPGPQTSSSRPVPVGLKARIRPEAPKSSVRTREEEARDGARARRRRKERRRRQTKPGPVALMTRRLANENISLCNGRTWIYIENSNGPGRIEGEYEVNFNRRESRD